MPDPVALSAFLKDLPGFTGPGTRSSKIGSWNAAMAMQDLPPRQLQEMIGMLTQQPLQERQMALQEKYAPYEHVINPERDRGVTRDIAMAQNEYNRWAKQGDWRAKSNKLAQDRLFDTIGVQQKDRQFGLDQQKAQQSQAMDQAQLALDQAEYRLKAAKFDPRIERIKQAINALKATRPGLLAPQQVQQAYYEQVQGLIQQVSEIMNSLNLKDTLAPGAQSAPAPTPTIPGMGGQETMGPQQGEAKPESWSDKLNNVIGWFGFGDEEPAATPAPAVSPAPESVNPPKMPGAQVLSDPREDTSYQRDAMMEEDLEMILKQEEENNMQDWQNALMIAQETFPGLTGDQLRNAARRILRRALYDDHFAR